MSAAPSDAIVDAAMVGGPRVDGNTHVGDGKTYESGQPSLHLLVPAGPGTRATQAILRMMATPGHRATGTYPVAAKTTSGIPDGSPTSIQVASDSGRNSWSTTIDEAPRTPARPPRDERWMSRSRVASGRERR